MADIFNEVDEALKQERAAALWQKYGPLIIGGAVLIIFMTALVTGVEAYTHHRQEKSTTSLLTAMEDSALESRVEKIKSLPDKYAAMAALSSADTALQTGNVAQAGNYLSLSTEAGAPQPFNYLAEMALASLPDAPAASSTEIMRDAEKIGGALRWQGVMTAATVAMSTENDPAKATELLAQIENADNVPASMKARASALKQYLSETMPVTNDTKKAEQQ